MQNNMVFLSKDVWLFFMASNNQVNNARYFDLLNRNPTKQELAPRKPKYLLSIN